MRLSLAQLIAAEPAQSAKFIFRAALLERLEPGYFQLVGGNDHFAADLMFDGVLAAELRHLTDSLHGHARLQGARFVIEAGVQDAAVVRALVAAEAGLFFQQRDRGRRQGLPELIGRAEPDQSTADDGYAPGVARGDLHVREGTWPSQRSYQANVICRATGG